MYIKSKRSISLFIPICTCTSGGMFLWDVAENECININNKLLCALLLLFNLLLARNFMWMFTTSFAVVYLIRKTRNFVIKIIADSNNQWQKIDKNNA